jgi:methionyl aminopeptidase
MTDVIKTPEEIEIMREGGRRAARVLGELSAMVRAGMKTRELDDQAKTLFDREGLKSAVYGYQGTFPGYICVSLNTEVVHGVPGDYVLKDGDVAGIDVTVSYQGLILDTAVTVGVGQLADRAVGLVRDTEKALNVGISVVKAGATTGDIGFAVQSYLEPKGYGVVRELVGHGVGRAMHEDPNVPNFGKPGEGPTLQAGQTITIEPMVTLGDWHVEMVEGEWPVRTADGSLAAHFEHTILVTANGAEILTK